VRFLTVLITILFSIFFGPALVDPGADGDIGCGVVVEGAGACGGSGVASEVDSPPFARRYAQ
jgi:hypothetical protein